jgi:hypothetical protein
VSPVRYELGITSQKTTFFVVTAVKTLNLTFEQMFFLLAQYGLRIHNVAILDV